MPKKFVGENSKAAAARARKSAKAEEEKERKEKEIEDELWKDEDKHVMRKQNRKEERERKKQEQLEKKHELKKLHDEEMDGMKSRQSAQTKVTRAQIEAEREKHTHATRAATKEAETPVNELPLQENVNRIEMTGQEARSVEEAIQVLSVKDNSNDMDRHPEKRVKAAYAAYEERMLPQLKAENPNLRLSQLKQMIRKDWMKSPENPLNQRFEQYNSKK